MRTAAVIIIGDEILKGKFDDENTPFLVRRLRELGVALERVTIVADTVAHIADEVRRSSASADLVLTTGGVGPTHDDRTLEAIAHAFRVPLVSCPELVDILSRRVGDLNAAARRMTELPEGYELLWDEGIWFPLVKMHNVHVFPGVPAFLKLKFEAACWRWQGEPVSSRYLRTDETEVQIAERLTEVQERFGTVEIGSYPRFEDGPRHVIVTLEGRDEDAVVAAEAYLAARLRLIEER